ncbi:carbonyl reductase [Akanthomyces lecanii RCEF 1005]|uniref:Carbonyl reductase n=1 Tax=Akanthomyces lecanii RCEF 1005 TaxID=1081108 RepID=A0A168JGL9_CORDF|nr:carbonyl reductase [Akanthomyces lecanii RCEF 1005]
MGYRDERKGTKTAEGLWSQGLSVEGICIDATDDASTKVAADPVGRNFGRLDVLIKDAGAITEGHLPQSTTLRQTWQDGFDLNAIAHVVATEAFLALLEELTSPRIVFVSSGLGYCSGRNDPNNQFPRFAFPAYRASEAAIKTITCHHASQYEAKGWKN